MNNEEFEKLVENFAITECDTEFELDLLTGGWTNGGGWIGSGGNRSYDGGACFGGYGYSGFGSGGGC